MGQIVAPPDNHQKLVIDPGVIAREIISHEERPLLTAWRDGHIKPVITRRILSHTLGLLNQIGISQDTLQLWALWLTHRSKVHILRDSDGPLETLCLEYIHAAAASEAYALVTLTPEKFEQDVAGTVKILTPSALREAGLLQSS
jgi:hypothetical protein